MTRLPSWLMVIFAVVLAVLGGRAISAPDKYAVQVPNGLAFSEFRGYEDWQLVAISQTEDAMAAILGNPDDDRRLPRRRSRQRQAISRWRQDREDPLETEKERGGSRADDGAGQPARRRLHGKGQQEILGQRRIGDTPSSTTTPRLTRSHRYGDGAKCGSACHTIVATKDYVFTAYPRR